MSIHGHQNPPPNLHSTLTPELLTKPMCLRCSKRVDGEEHMKSRTDLVPVGAACDREPNQKCSWCATTRHVCDDVPHEFIRIVNDLLRRKEYLKSLDPGHAHYQTMAASLEQKQAKYTKAVEAHIRAASRFGKHAKPETSMDVMLLVLEALQDIRQELSIANDLRRHELGHTPSNDSRLQRQLSPDEWSEFTIEAADEASEFVLEDEKMEIIELSDDGL